MSEDIKENRETIDNLRNFLIKQLKEGSWTGSAETFRNKHFYFYTKGVNEIWNLRLISNGTIGEEIEVSDLLSKWHFWFLRTFYVERSIVKNSRVVREDELAKKSKKFLNSNKDIIRDVKLDKLLD